jgi:hypothetical protein
LEESASLLALEEFHEKASLDLSESAEKREFVVITVLKSRPIHNRLAAGY